MNKVTGYIEYQVLVRCPYCRKRVDLTKIPGDWDWKLQKAVYGNKWENVGLRYNCPHCGRRFELDQLGY